MFIDIFNTQNKYNIIYADPPWSYADKLLGMGKRGAIANYNVMDINDICALPVKEISHNDSILFMWVTMPMLDVCMKVIYSWGFTYKTCAFTWIKKTKNNKLFFGLGRWTRGNAELCLLATKGKPKRVANNVFSILEEQIRGHSRKPAITRDKIVQLCGDLPRIELFSRDIVDGWCYWGDHDYKLLKDNLNVRASK